MSGPAHKASYIASFETTVGSATLPQGSLYSGASNGFALIEAGWFTNITSQKRVQLNRLTTTGTQGSVVIEGRFDDDAPANTCQAFATHTGAPTLGDRLHTVPLHNSLGAGIYYGWHDNPIECPAGTSNGIGFLPTTAAGGADVTLVWEE